MLNKNHKQRFFYLPKKQKSAGFTLGELLISISIIIVLSSIVLFSLGSSKSKGENFNRLSTMGQYITAFEMYRQDKGSYPTTSASVCLGVGSGLSPKCGLNGGVLQSNTFNNKLKPYMADMPQLPDLALKNPKSTNDISWDGAVYKCSTSACNQYTIEWYMRGPGSPSCGQGKAITTKISDDTGCIYTSMVFK